MRVLVILIVLMIQTVSALNYEEKPNVTAYIVGSNHLKKGENILNVVIYNPAKIVKVDYYDEEEAAFFSEREEMLFTAYNVEVELLGNEFIDVKTEKQMIPALPPLKPVNLQFFVKVREDAKAGKYDLRLRVKFDRIEDLVSLETFQPKWIPVQKSNETYTYEYRMLTGYYKLRYKEVDFEISNPIYVEEDFKLEVLDVETENMFFGKGKITVEVKNVGEEIGRNCYLVLEVPYGFKPSSKCYVGDLKPNETVKANFYVGINTRDEGNYTFKIKAVYSDEYGRIRESYPVPFGVYISSSPSFDVIDVVSGVFVNSKGTVVVKVKPNRDLDDVSFYLTSKPPLSILSEEFHLGDVKAGEIYELIFKVGASDEAKPVTYPAEMSMRYRSMDEYFYTDPVAIGIKVNPKTKFEVYGTPKIAAGSEEIVAFTIKNVGNFTIREATARLTITDPFSSSDDTAYIGTLKPGESTEIKFKLSVDADATPKKYGLNLEVKYKDLEDEWAISEPTKAVIEVVPPKPPYGVTALVAIIAIVAVAYYLRRRKK